MDVIVILFLLYVVVCWLCRRRTSRLAQHRKVDNFILLVSSILVVLGCITPINFRYTFLIAIGLMLGDYFIMKKIEKGKVQ